MLRVGSYDVESLVVTLPEYGNWSVLASLIGGKFPAKGSKLQVTVGDLVMSGVVTGSGVHGGRASAFIVGGSGGWQSTQVEADSIASTAGVKLADAAAALAITAGEQITLEPDVIDTRLGQQWTRPAGAAIDALEDFGVSWWMSVDGVTHLGTRPTVTRPTVTRPGKFGIETYDVATGTVVLLPQGDGVAAAQPGSSLTVDGTPFLVRSCVIRASASRIAVEVNGGVVDRLSQVLSAIQARARRRAQLVGPHVYRVKLQIGGLVYVQAQEGSLDLPDYLALPIAFGLQGVKQSVSTGEDVLVAFQGGDIGRPIIVGWRDGVPSETTLDAGDKIVLGKSLGTGKFVEIAQGTRAVAMGDALSSWAASVHAFIQAASSAAPTEAAAELTAYTAAATLGWSATSLKVK